MSTRWMNSRGTMLAPRAGGSARDAPPGEYAPGGYKEPLPRSPPAVKGYGDEVGASPAPVPPLCDWFRTYGGVGRTRFDK